VRLPDGAVANGIYFAPTQVLPMEHRFDKHYTRDEASALFPQIRQWLELLNRLRKDLERTTNA